MTGIDPRFHAAKRRAGRRQMRGVLWRNLPFVGAGALALGLGAAIWLTWDLWKFGPGGDPGSADLAALDADAAAQNAQFVSAFVDLAGDPLIIRLSEGAGGQNVRSIDRPLGLDPTRVISDLVMVTDDMVSTEEHFITTLPSSQEDFAFFQAQRQAALGTASPRQPTSRAPAPAPAAQPTGPSGGLDGTIDASIDDSEAGWGETLDNTNEALPGFTETAVENTTSVAFVRVEAARKAIYRDIFVRIAVPQSLADVLISNGYSEAAGAEAAAAAEAIFGRKDLTPGEVLAMRGLEPVPGRDRMLAQLSLYSGDTYIGALGRTSEAALVEASDPWVQDDLFNYTDAETETAAAPVQQYRILDAFYSAGIRNRMPAALVGEAISMLSKSHDLNSFASPGDRMTVVYAEHPAPGDTGGGQVLYVSLKGDDIGIECFVFAEPGSDFGCYGAQGGAAAGGGGLVNGMLTPVRGVMTSTFGPRNHPILKTVRIHKGVDWAAPIGTPITAAFDGTVAFAGDGGDYGNLVKLAHANGFETYYAHMDALAEGIAAGGTVRAGDLVGYLGSTGLSTGPHLHFELRQNGEAVDPIGGGASTAGGAVEALVDQIVRVESGGQADAKNPLSTATGLGQFIESTWMRMMKTYRPDLATTLSREELLELRKDPTISRQMITNLARESEAYLRARGHSVSAGRLYLAHFLGAEGAAQVLSAPPESDLAELLGQGVISANPFLTGKNAAYVADWAEQKMSGRGARMAALAPEPAGLAEFRAAIRAALTAG